MGAGDLVAAALAHLACGAFGGALALLLGPPLRNATTFTIILAVLIASIAADRALGVASGPGGVAQALSNTQDNTVSGQLVVACAVAVIEAGLLAYGARWQARWRG